jgi:glycosyltransferase involved in cell wall biosynthesis
MNSQYVVSVVIPTYNRANLLGRAIRSVINQTYPDFEILVIDDCSKDNTEEVVKGFSESQLKYIRHGKNKGGSAARNTGITSAKGEYIALLDDDDEWLPEKLEKQIQKFKTVSHKVGVVYTGCSEIMESSGKINFESIPDIRGNIYINMLRDCFIGSPTPLIRKDCFNKTGLFDETLLSNQDWDMWIRLASYYEFDLVPEILAKRYIHGSQISISLKARIQAYENLIKKYKMELSEYPSILSRHLRRLAILYCLADRKREGRKLFMKSIKVRPFEKGGYIHLFLSIFMPGIHKNLLEKYRVQNVDGVSLYY